MLDELLRLDRALSSTWERYLEFLDDPALAPAQAAEFLDRHAAEPDEYLGARTGFPRSKALWLLRLGRDADALDALKKSRLYGQYVWGWEYPSGMSPEARARFSKQVEDSPAYRVNAAFEASAVATEYGAILAAHKQAWKRGWQREIVQELPLTWLERGPVPVKRMWDACNPKAQRKSLFKGDDAYLFRCFTRSFDEKWAASPELFDATPKLKASKEKYCHNAYSLQEFNPLMDPFDAPYINHFLNTRAEEGSFDLEALLQKTATERGGDFPYIIGNGENIVDRTEINVNASSNGDTIYLLYILKKCGCLEKIFAALPRLPEDFPLLLMCFADRGIREKVETYMDLPGLADMYDLAFAPRHLNVKDQLKLIEFGRKNPRFQELLATSLCRYGYHLYNQYHPSPDWYVQDFAHFSRAHCCDVMLFLTSASDLLPQVRLFLEYGPGTGFAFGSVLYQGFTDVFEVFYRNLLAYLAMRGDSRLAAWRMADLDNERTYHAGQHKRLKTADLVAALQKSAGK